MSQGDPNKVIYSLLLFESAPQGNLLRVHTDSLEQPLDVNEGMKLELGSTAKLRTLTHYLELVAELYGDPDDLGNRMSNFSRSHHLMDPQDFEQESATHASKNYFSLPWTGPIRRVLMKPSSQGAVCMPLVTSIPKITDASCRSGKPPGARQTSSSSV